MRCLLLFCLFLLAFVANCHYGGSGIPNGPHRVYQAPKADNSVGQLNRLGETLVFSDDFDELDLEIWEHDITLGGGGNWEFEYYTNNRTNSFVRDGVLYLKPTLTSDKIGEANLQNGYTMDVWGSAPSQCTGNAFYGCSRTSGANNNILNPIQSAKLRSTSAFSFKYGRVEVRAKLPVGDWIWPAIWMLPRFSSYGDWPASGEIDIVESRGNVGYPGGGVEAFGSTLHWGPDWSNDPFELTHATMSLPTGTFADDFHIFGLKWNSTGLFTYVDDESNVVLKVAFKEPFWSLGGFDKTTYHNPWEGRSAAAPFDQKFYLIFNVAVGGTAGYFPDGVGGKPWTNTDGHAVNSFYNAKGQWYSTWKGDDPALQIDWVRVYQDSAAKPSRT